MNFPKFNKKSLTNVITTDIETPSLLRRDKKQLTILGIGTAAVIIILLVIFRSSALTNQFIAVDSNTTSSTGNPLTINNSLAAGGSYVRFDAPPPPPPPPTPAPPPPAPTPPPPPPTPAPTGHRFYFQPDTASVQNGSNTTLALRLDPDGEAIDLVDNVTITYDAAKLQFVSLDATGSPFEIELLREDISGSVKFSRSTAFSGNPPPVTTDSLIVNMTFRALTGSGTSTLNVTGNAYDTAGATNPADGTATVNFQ